jgi:hypothetical protein
MTIKGCDYTGISVARQRTASISGSVSITYCNFIANTDGGAALVKPETTIDLTLDFTLQNNIVYNNTYDNVGVANLGEYTGTATIERNIFIPDASSTDSFGVSATNNGTTALIYIRYNVIHKRAGLGNVIGLGNGDTAGSIGDLDGSEIVGNVLAGPDYYGNTGTGSHSILVLNQQDVAVKYNRLLKNFLGIVIKSEHASPQTFTATVMYTILEGCPLMSRGMRGVQFYGNTVINSYIHLLETAGTLQEALNCTIKNNVFNNVDYVGACMLIEDNAETGLTADYNIVYNYDSYQNLTGAGTLAEWQAAGFGANSSESNPLLNSDYIPGSGSPAIGGAETLAATYDDGLGTATDFGSTTETPSIVIKQQSGSWDAGAYVT